MKKRKRICEIRSKEYWIGVQVDVKIDKGGYQKWREI